MLPPTFLQLLLLTLGVWVAATFVATWVEALRSGVAPLVGPYVRIARRTNPLVYWAAVLLLLIPAALGLAILWAGVRAALPIQWIPPPPANGFAHPAAEPTGPGGYFPAVLTRTTYTCSGRPNPMPLMPPLKVDHYAQHLAAAGELSLLAPPTTNSGDGDVFRFTWLRSFDRAVIIRIQDGEDGVLRLTATRLSGMGGYEPGGVETRVERTLTASEAGRFERALSGAKRLKLPAVSCRLGYDGASWVFEGRDAGAYRFVDRWSPEQGQVRELGLVMLDLAGWSAEKVY